MTATERITEAEKDIQKARFVVAKLREVYREDSQEPSRQATASALRQLDDLLACAYITLQPRKTSL